jgi:predicted transcriptional regulator
MSTTQLLIRLPDELAKRFKRSVSPRNRSKFIQRLLEEALPPEDGDDDPLYQAALAVEKEEALGAEMDEWETATIEDGFAGGNPDQVGNRPE